MQDDFKSIVKIDSHFQQIQDVDILLERILFEARKMVHADAGSIYIRKLERKAGKTADLLTIKYSQNDTLQKALAGSEKLIFSVFSIPINEKTISGYCALTQQLLNIPDAYDLPPNVPYSFGKTYDQISKYKTTSMLTVPLINADKILFGVIQIINAKDKEGRTIPFSHDHEMLITHFAGSATVALQKASMIRTMILRMIKMAELRDPKETGSHVNRVASYSAEIYKRWANNHNVSEREKDKFTDSLRVASMLHDVGKVAISDVILKKPGGFTPEEKQVMETHTLHGATLFDESHSDLDALSHDIAFTHHENWDGSGYPGWINPHTREAIKMGENDKPLGKKGEEIPLAGRIVSIADVFDALSSKRSYKSAWSEEDVLNEIRKLSGTKFDPELVDIFFDVLPSIKQIQNLYPDEEQPSV